MELFGISGSEFLVLVVLAVLVAGPKGVVQALALLKSALAKFREWSGRLRQDGNITALAADLNIRPENFDLSQYDPRALVRQAVREEMQAWAEQVDPSPRTGGVASRATPARARGAGLAATTPLKTPATTPLKTPAATPVKTPGEAPGALDSLKATDSQTAADPAAAAPQTEGRPWGDTDGT
ncbi:MAG: hypothetical protein LBD77_10390 [Bifidobacteriaceae bacterium]|jgi:sec-independent protein translocase protein TatB|nr:hypothetical protein [Bifidobacteriaceae bacterium]